MNNGSGNIRQKFNAFCCSIAIVIFLIFEIRDINDLIKSLKLNYYNFPLPIFENCILYQSIFDILKELFLLLFGFSLLIFCLYILLKEEDADSLLPNTFLYFFYVIFGPFLLGIISYCLIHNKKFLYNCIDNDINKKQINIKIFDILFYIIFVSVITFIIGSVFMIFIYFSDSIDYKITGNYFVGCFFWKLYLMDNNENNNIPENNNQLNNNNVAIENREESSSSHFAEVDEFLL